MVILFDSHWHIPPVHHLKDGPIAESFVSVIIWGALKSMPITLPGEMGDAVIIMPNDT